MKARNAVEGIGGPFTTIVGRGVVFALIGPLVGATTVLVTMGIASFGSPKSMLELGPMILAFGVAVGAVPALATGALVGMMALGLRSEWWLTGLGGVLGAVCASLFLVIGTVSDGRSVEIEPLVMFGTCGGVAGFVTTLLTRRMRRAAPEVLVPTE